MEEPIGISRKFWSRSTSQLTFPLASSHNFGLAALWPYNRDSLISEQKNAG